MVVSVHRVESQLLGGVDVQSAEARMSVGREVERAVSPERREHLVARGVYLRTEILRDAELMVVDNLATPDVVASVAAYSVGHEVDMPSVWRDGRVRHGLRTVADYRHRLRLAPFAG